MAEPREIGVEQASLQTAAISIRTLQVNRKQMTLAVFRQLVERSALREDGTLAGEVWGWVNYHPDKCEGEKAAHYHYIWQDGNKLVRGRLDRLIFKLLESTSQWDAHESILADATCYAIAALQFGVAAERVRFEGNDTYYGGVGNDWQRLIVRHNGAQAVHVLKWQYGDPNPEWKFWYNVRQALTHGTPLQEETLEYYRSESGFMAKPGAMPELDHEGELDSLWTDWHVQIQRASDILANAHASLRAVEEAGQLFIAV